MAKTRTIVHIGGREYPIIANESAEYIHRVALYVDRRMGEISAASRVSANLLAVLTCINVADELLKAQDELIRVRKELNDAQQAQVQMQRENALLKSGRAPVTAQDIKPKAT